MANANSISDLERAEHINTGAGTGVKRVIYFEDDGAGNISTVISTNLNLLYEVVGNYVYIGQSSGIDGGQAIWRIKRLDTLNGKLYFADNVKTFTKTWADRSSYTY